MAKNRKPRHVQDNFRDMVVAATKANTKEHIQGQIMELGKILTKNLAEQFAPYDMFLDMVTDILMEKLDETEDSLENRLADKEDKVLNLEIKEGAAERGNHVRFKVRDTNGKTDKFRRLVVKDLGSKNPELHKDFEEALIGMSPGETKNITFKVEDKEYSYDVKMIRVCLQKKPRAVETPPAETTTETTAQTEGNE